MAWVDGRWLKRAERAEYIETLRQSIMTLHDADDTEKLAWVDEYERLTRIHRAEVDSVYFNYEYFGEDANPDNQGNWIPAGAVAPDFHRELGSIMDEVSHQKRNKRVAAAAPRSHAKSSYLSKGYPIKEIVYRLRKYIIIISETPTVAKGNLEWISLQLKHNEKLRADFGPLLDPKQQMNPRDNSEEFVAWEPRDNGTKQYNLALVQAASSGQALRGRNWNGNRPDLVICDDVDSEKNNNTEQLRKELKDWFKKVVTKLGGPEGNSMAIIFMGTTVHADSLLLDIMNNRGDFESKKYKALISPPDRADLWEQCREIYQDRENPDSERLAELFYTAHREEMDAGAEVLWPDVQPLWKLMKIKWDDGSKAFSTEYQNEPIDAESAIFDLESYRYWDASVEEGRRLTLEQFKSGDYLLYLGVDMAFGKKKGDYSALALIAKHRITDVEYVAYSWGDRIGIDAFLAHICTVVDEWQPDGIAAEAVQAQEHVVDQLIEKLREIGYPAKSRVHKYYPKGDKLLRIEAMEPDLATGQLILAKRHALLLEQMERFGSNSHDDLPDAMHIARTLTKKRRRRITSKPSWA